MGQKSSFRCGATSTAAGRHLARAAELSTSPRSLSSRRMPSGNPYPGAGSSRGWASGHCQSGCRGPASSSPVFRPPRRRRRTRTAHPSVCPKPAFHEGQDRADDRNRDRGRLKDFTGADAVDSAIRFKSRRRCCRISLQLPFLACPHSHPLFKTIVESTDCIVQSHDGLCFAWLPAE